MRKRKTEVRGKFNSSIWKSVVSDNKFPSLSSPYIYLLHWESRYYGTNHYNNFVIFYPVSSNMFMQLSVSPISRYVHHDYLCFRVREYLLCKTEHPLARWNRIHRMSALLIGHQLPMPWLILQINETSTSCSLPHNFQ